MSLSKYIDVPVFIASLAFGLFAVYVTMPDLRTIYVYPTPENAALLQYRDKTGTCFSIKEKEVACPANKSEISVLPMQA